MNDLPLFAGRKTERQSTRRATSDKAWEAVPRGAASLIHAHLLDRGPSTVEEIMDELALSHQTASSAVNRLMRVGWLIDAGLRVFNRTGRMIVAGGEVL